MKSNFHKLVLLFLVVSIISASSTRNMASEKGEVDQEINGKGSDLKIATVDSFDKVMGVDDEEYCRKLGDEECWMRRAVLEAHLDYIYTQNRVP